VVVLLVLAALAGSAFPAAAGPPHVGSAIYVVRQDPRLCPSPLCGGYWVQLANRSRTRCSDGVLRAHCYTARAVDEERHAFKEAAPDRALVRADLESWSVQGMGELGTLVVASVFGPVGDGASAGRYFRVADRGIRCVKAPCFSLRASVLNRDERSTLSGVDLGVVPVDTRDQVEAALSTRSGVLARGRIVRTSAGGRVLRATRFYLRPER